MMRANPPHEAAPSHSDLACSSMASHSVSVTGLVSLGVPFLACWKQQHDRKRMQKRESVEAWKNRSMEAGYYPASLAFVETLKQGNMEMGKLLDAPQPIPMGQVTPTPVVTPALLN